MRFQVALISILLAACSDKKKSSLIMYAATGETTAAQSRVPSKYSERYVFYLDCSDAGIIPVKVLARFPYTYYVIGQDTLTNRDWKESDSNYLYYPDTSGPYQYPVKIYSPDELVSILDNSSSELHWLIHCKDSAMSCIGSGIIHKVQLDADPETERIAEVPNGWYHFYLIYDSLQSGWNLINQLSIPDRGDYAGIDVSLRGFFGLRSTYGGTCFHAVDRVFYACSDNQIARCFTINETVGLCWPVFSQYAWFTIESASNYYTIDNNTISIQHDIIIALEPDSDYEKEIIYAREKVNYRLVKSNNGPFYPNKKLPGFQLNEGGDSTEFYPESYGQYLLSKIKLSGTEKQREYLEHFEYDSTSYTR